MSLHVCPGEIYILDSQPFGQFLGKKLSFWLSACSVLIVAPLLFVHPSFPLVFWNGRFQVIVSIPDHCLPFY